MNIANLLYSRLVTAWKGERTETEASAVLGVAPNTLGNWTDGTSLPPATKIPALAAALGVPVDDLRALVDKDRQARRSSLGTRPGSHARNSNSVQEA